MTKIFNENVVIITGASMGHGAALARQLAGQGAWLALVARSVDLLEEVAAECRELGGKAIVIPTDLTDEAQCKALIERTVEAYGRIDTLVSNAAVDQDVRLDEIQNTEIIERFMTVNYLGAAYCTAYALPYLRETQGRLVAITSMGGRTGLPTKAAYAASKHAIVGFFESMRVELLDSGVTVTIVFLDWVATGMHVRALGGDGKPVITHNVDYDMVMQPDEAAHITLNAMAKRKREEMLTLRGKLGQWVKLIAPGVVDRMALEAIRKGR